MINRVPNVNSIYNVRNKSVQNNLDSTYLWHCRLAHISKKRIEKLQHDGLLKSTNEESFDKCVSCLSGKMTRKLYVSRQGASYFITFTDDYSRYGYVYLLKHKPEVCETFKVFKNEVENQLGKTIKALRSDRRGEYISQEYKDYLKACRFVQQLTPPYTPQHNEVSEMRNCTLLDMVRSMMNLTTLPLSFWDYDLEFVARILNMVPTKKVDKTSYELWYEKVPNLSYLKEMIEVGRMAVELKEIQDKDTSPSENTCKIPIEVEGFKPPQEEVVLVCRSARTHRAPNRLCLNVEVEEHSLGNLNEPTNYKAAMLDLEFDKWLDVINAKIQSMRGNQVWCLVDLPHNGKYEFILGIKIYRDRSKRLIRLSQSAYMDKILKRFRIDNSKRGNIPMQERLDLNKTQGASTPGENPSKPYWTAVKTILKYLRNTKDMFLVYGGNPEAELRVDCYCDAGFKTDRDDTKSQIGYVFILNGGAVDWKSSNKSTTAMSATEAEYIAASEAAMEAIWIRKFISVLGKINLRKVHTDNKLADPFMKALSKGKLTQQARSMGLCFASSFM
ncbi:retrotransposon protein, putative, ty1-copia subclass [Tanacetum coccineum]